MKALNTLGLVAALALTGCATAPCPVAVPKVVEVPVDASPKVVLPARPVMAVPASHSAADVVRAAALRIEAWKAYALQLEALLAPYTSNPTTTPAEPAK